MVIKTDPIHAENDKAIWKIQELLHLVEPEVGEKQRPNFERVRLLLPSNHPRWARSWQTLWRRAQDAERDYHGYFRNGARCGVLFKLAFDPDAPERPDLEGMCATISQLVVEKFAVAALVAKQLNGNFHVAVPYRAFLPDGLGFAKNRAVAEAEGDIFSQLRGKWAKASIEPLPAGSKSENGEYGGPSPGPGPTAAQLVEVPGTIQTGEIAAPEASTTLQDSRSIEELLAAIRLKNDDWGEPTHHPCPADDIRSAEAAFRNEFGHNFPAAYKRILALTNGVYFDGMTIWPATPKPDFEETILQANQNLRDTFSEDFIYFGQNGEELFVLSLKTGLLCAIEFVGKPVWMEFADADEMFRFMLERNLLID